MVSKYREVSFGIPELELAPDGYNLDSFVGRVTVRPIHFDIDTGNRVLEPVVDSNVNLGKLTPKESSDWAQVLKVASMIAGRENLSLLDSGVATNAYKLWSRVDEVLK